MQYFRKEKLTTTSGESIDIRWPGQLNADAGPDFTGARICIGGLNWVGNVEIHVLSSNWVTHGHDTDPAMTMLFCMSCGSMTGYCAQRCHVDSNPRVGGTC